MTGAELLALLRAELHDEAKPQLWSDVELLSYIDDGQKMFCRLAGGLADSSSAMTKLKARAGQPYAVLDPRILKVRYAHRATDSSQVSLINFEDIEHGVLPELDDSSYRVGQIYKIDDTQGQIRYMILGMEANKVRFVYVPAEDQIVNLIVYRLPLDSVSTETKGSSLEIDSQHHRHLLGWAKHLAYSKQDAETYDKTKRVEFAREFHEYCEQARQERERREHKPRTVLYGGL